MPDYRTMFDPSPYMYARDLDEYPGRERTLEIKSVSRGELTGDQGRKSKKPMVAFVDEPLLLAINKTNGKTIAKLYGTDTVDWSGKLITVYATTTEFGGETKDCIRVKPQRPERGESRRTTPSADRKSNGSGSRQSKADRDIEASAVAAQYLCSQYQKCDGSEGQGEARMAELKIERGRHWPTLTDADRDAVGEAAKAAKARIDAAIAGSPAAPGGAPATEADKAAEGVSGE